MSFEKSFKQAVEQMIPKSHDDYIELKYSDQIYVHVWSHDDGEGCFELYAIVPHDSVETVPEGSQLPPEIPGVEEFYADIEEYLYEVTGEEFDDIVFYLLEVVDDGTWQRDASEYGTHKLTVEDF